MSLAIRQHFPDGTQITLPKGGYILWVKLPNGIAALKLQQAALTNGINLAPGGLFSNSDEFDQYIRLNCALPMDAELRLAIKTLGELAEGLNG